METKKELEKLTSQLIKFETVASNTEAFLNAFEFIEGYFEGTDCEIKRYKKDDVLSLVLTTKNLQEPSDVELILNGHIDVVEAEESQFEPVIKQSRLYGRGALDMKGAVAAFLFAFKRYINKNKNPAPVAVMIPGDEETGGEAGTEHLLKDIGWKPEFALIGEGRPEFALVTKEKGVAWMEITTEGKTAHSSRPWEGENALNLLLDDIEAIRKEIPELKAPGWETSLNIASISTPNRTQNKIPSSTKALLDVRFTEDFAETPQEVGEKLREKIKNSELKLTERGSLFRTRDDNKYVQEFMEIVSQYLKKEPEISYNSGASDARFFAEENIPALVCGPTGDGIHSDEEWVNLDFLASYADMLVQYLNSF